VPRIIPQYITVSLLISNIDKKKCRLHQTIKPDTHGLHIKEYTVGDKTITEPKKTYEGSRSR